MPTATRVATLVLLATSLLRSQSTSSQSTSAQPNSSQSARILTAANSFLSTLTDPQKSALLFSYDDDAQRKRWSNFPVSMSKRAGLSLKELSPAQRTAAMALVAAALSPRGYEKVLQIMEGDEVLKNNERGNAIFGKDLYYISILGTPSATSPWMPQFGGHHLALNLTISGDQGILTPSLTAAQPATYSLNGKTIRPLGAENDKAFALLASLDDTQRAQAILNYRVGDLVLGPGQDGKKIQPEGLKVSSMTDRQRALLLDLIAEWVGIANDKATSLRMAEIKSGLPSTWFAWSGPTSAEPGKNGTAYYRIQGPTLVIEYSPQRMGGDASNHIHTIYRDPTNDYGRKTTTQK